MDYFELYSTLPKSTWKSMEGPRQRLVVSFHVMYHILSIIYHILYIIYHTLYIMYQILYIIYYLSLYIYIHSILGPAPWLGQTALISHTARGPIDPGPERGICGLPERVRGFLRGAFLLGAPYWGSPYHSDHNMLGSRRSRLGP